MTRTVRAHAVDVHGAAVVLAGDSAGRSPGKRRQAVPRHTWLAAKEDLVNEPPQCYPVEGFGDDGVPPVRTE
ncbi:hypothetical protein WEI85_18810 [Actinomycetes bacterium KLBMP 9797]